MGDLALELLRDPERHQAYGKYARESVLSRFMEERVVAEYEAYYEEILG